MSSMNIEEKIDALHIAMLSGFLDVNNKLLIIAQDLSSFKSEVSKKFDAVNVRFDAVDAKFDTVDARFDEVNIKFDNVDQRFNKVSKQIQYVKNQVKDSDTVTVSLYQHVTNEINRLETELLNHSSTKKVQPARRQSKSLLRPKSSTA